MLTKFAITNHVLTLSILLVLIVAGVSAFTAMPRDDMPPFLIRVVSVVTTYPGAGPERIENLITDPIEKVVQEIPEMDYVTSESRTGISVVNVYIKESEFDLQPIFDRIRRKVEGVQKQLPEGAAVVVKDEVGDVFGIIVGLTADGYTYAETKAIADEIRNALIKLPNAAKVEIHGIQDERIYVEFDDTRLADLGLTKKKLQNLIAATNIVVPGGDIKVADRRIILEPTGSFETLDDLANVIVAASGGTLLHLRDITTITRGYVFPRRSIVKINGVEGLAIAVNLKKGGNIIALGAEVDQTLNAMRRIYPHGVEMERVASQDVVVEKSVRDFVGNLVQSVVVVLLVMLLFLGLRTGMIVASLIPVTMVMTLLIMSVLGVGLNKVSLASLIIALGMLVDNAIVMSEAIMVRMEQGVAAVDAAVDAARELIIPLLTSSLTTAAAFMAFYLAESVLGEIMGQIFVVVTIALLSSWLLSLTMVTLFCVHGLKLKPKAEDKPGIWGRVGDVYKRFLLVNLRRPWLTISAVVVISVISVFLARSVPFIFMPKSDRPVVSVNLELPLGTAIERTAAVVDEIEAFIKQNLKTAPARPEGVENWSSYVGQGAPKYDLGYSPPESNSHAAHILVNTTSDGINDQIIARLERFIFEHFPEATYAVSRLISGGGSANPIEIRISGRQIETLYAIADQVKAALIQRPGTKNVAHNWGLQTKKLVVDIQPTQAQIAGITNQDIATSLQTMLGGAQTGTFREEEKSIPIIMRNQRSARLDVESLQGLNIYAQQSGKNVPLSQVADVKVVWQASKILRRDLTRTIAVTSDVRDGFTASKVINGIKPWLKQAAAQWPVGYSYEFGGDAEGSADAMGAVAAKLPLSVFIILVLLIAQFNSIRKPAIILTTIPLGLIGVILGLLVTGSYFSFMAFLGVISLAGIVINNGIVLLDRIDIEIREFGKSAQAAIVDAALGRLRPILLTTATTAVGLIPLWLGGGLLWEPMAIGIIFGLLFATLITLVFVPVLYRLFFRVSFQ